MEGTCEEQENEVLLRDFQEKDLSSGGLKDWKYGSPLDEVVVSVDDVDRTLRERFLLEANSIIDVISEEIKSVNLRRYDSSVCIQEDADIDMFQILALFLPRSMLEKVSEVANKVLASNGKELVTASELLGILLLHVLCASYGESATTICAKEERDSYLQLGISPSRYKEVWRALSGSKTRTRVEHQGVSWRYNTSAGISLMMDLEQQVAEVNRRLLFIPNATIASLDDDHLRLSARTVSDLTTLRSVNNPTKALGPVNNAVCSALTSAYIAGHFSRAKGQIIDTWIRLVQLLQGCPTQVAIAPMCDTIFASDRGYNSKEVISFINETLGATALGTHKRTPDFPFVFGDGPIRKKHKGMLVSEKGCRSVYKAELKPISPNGKVVEAAVYRESFSGRVAAVYHNNKSMFSASHYTIVPQSAYRSGVNKEHMSVLSTVFRRETDSNQSAVHIKVRNTLEAVRLLTYFQSEDPCWFLLRAFCFTSRTSHGFIRTIAADYEQRTRSLAQLLKGTRFDYTEVNMPEEEYLCVDLIRSNWESVLYSLGMRKDSIARYAARELEERIAGMTRSAASSLRVDEITQLLAKANRTIPSRVLKAQLVEMLMALKEEIKNGLSLCTSEETGEEGLDHNASGDQSPSDNAPDPRDTVKQLRKMSLQAWVMKPLVTTVGMRDGSANEAQVLKALPIFFDNNHTAVLRSVNGDDVDASLRNNESRESLEFVRFRVDLVRTTGLICDKQNGIFGDSPDAIVGMVDDSGNTCCAAVEVKTMTAPKTIERARSTERAQGKCVMIKDIGLIECSDKLFKEVVPSTEYRLQCLHHATVVGVERIVFVVAKGGRGTVGEIIYVAVLDFSLYLIEAYRLCLESVYRTSFQWIGKGASDIRGDYNELVKDSYASDIQSFCSLL